jgi:preprotein translocase subunit SecE
MARLWRQKHGAPRLQGLPARCLSPDVRRPERAVGPQECSSAGRASVSKTESRGFESPHSCHYICSTGRLPARNIESREPQEHGQETGIQPVRDQEPRRQDGRGDGARRRRRGDDAAKAPAAPKKRTSPVQFFREVRAETRKITWTTRKETWITSVMVFIMVVMASLFFTAIDWRLGFAVNQLLKLAAG